MKHCEKCKAATGDKFKFYSCEKGVDGKLHAVVVDEKYRRVNLCAKATEQGVDR